MSRSIGIYLGGGFRMKITYTLYLYEYSMGLIQRQVTAHNTGTFYGVDNLNSIQIVKHV